MIADQRVPDEELVNVLWVVMEINWPIPTWIDPEVYENEFKQGDDEAATGQNVVNMFNYLGPAIDRLFAGGTDFGDVVSFKYWRKLNSEATKMKPVKLEAKLYEHPEYANPWMLVRYSNE
jgi:hypothetical protein